MNLETIDISGAVGITALITLTGNFLFGMLLSTGYKKITYWKKLPPLLQRIDINAVHNYTAYIAWGLVMVHILLIPLDNTSKFQWADLFVPMQAPHQPLFVTLGIVSLYALVAVILTTQKAVKRKLGYRLWKNIHLISYCTSILFVIHGVVMDPLLKDRPVDWIDAEKLVCELCGLVLIAATVIRYRYHLAQQKMKQPVSAKINSL